MLQETKNALEKVLKLHLKNKNRVRFYSELYFILIFKKQLMRKGNVLNVTLNLINPIII